ncbi:hypothetical protein P4O66_020097, partial [Electrophorus voltai]
MDIRGLTVSQTAESSSCPRRGQVNDSWPSLFTGPVSAMEQEPGSLVAGRAEEHSGSLLLTYFQGDINSMVDAHFSRALRNISKPKADAVKGKRNRKSGNSNPEPSLRGWEVISAPQGSAYFPGQHYLSRHQEPQISPRLPAIPPMESSAAWPIGPQQGTCMPPVPYGSAPSVEGLAETGQPYGSSLLNLLHNDRPNINTVMVASSKQEFVPVWTRHMEFRDQMTPDHSCDYGTEIHVKDLDCVTHILKYAAQLECIALLPLLCRHICR